MKRDIIGGILNRRMTILDSYKGESKFNSKKKRKTEAYLCLFFQRNPNTYHNPTHLQNHYGFIHGFRFASIFLLETR
jgi:radical SAM superfamily enzyme